MVVQSGQDRDGDNGTGALDRPTHAVRRYSKEAQPKEVLRRRYDPALLLPAKARVDIRPSIVDAANLKPHRSPMAIAPGR
jgi:hypothetical protein